MEYVSQSLPMEMSHVHHGSSQKKKTRNEEPIIVIKQKREIIFPSLF